MRIEMMITAAQLPKDGLTLIHQEMERRVWEYYPNARIRIRKGANNHLEIYAPKDDKKAANIIVEQMFNEAEEWLYA